MEYYENCIRCGRKLKTEESRTRGFGKVCWEKWQMETKSNKLFKTGGADNANVKYPDDIQAADCIKQQRFEDSL